MEVAVKSNSFDDPSRDPLRAFVVERVPNNPRTALFAKITSSQVQKNPKHNYHASNQWTNRLSATETN
jgi:hypothetical protein